MDKPPPYNPNAFQSPYPPPPYQAAPPTATVFAEVHPGSSTTTIISGPNYGTLGGGPTPVIVQPVPVPNVILVGGCPACRVGVLEDEFTLGGLCCAFWFFPIGILCCLAMRDRRCTNCGATFQ